MSSPMTTHGNMKTSNEIKPQILHNRLPQEIKLSSTECTMASSMMSPFMMSPQIPPPPSNEQQVELLGYKGYGYHHLYPYGYGGYGGYGYGYRRHCYPYGCHGYRYPWYYF